MLTVDEKDSGKTIDLKKGEKCKINLIENPSTGYSWLEEVTPDSDILELEQQEVMSGNYTIGGNSSRQWVFQAVKPGVKVLRFVYQRPWDKTPSPKKFEITVNVTG